MALWGLIGFVFSVLVEPNIAAAEQTPLSDPEIAAQHILKYSKKSKSHNKKHKSKKKKLKKQRKKPKVYSPQKIEQRLNSDPQNGLCNRMNCSSKLEIAKSCLKTKADHRTNKGCFHAFCAYGCNDEDYSTRQEVFEFCKKTCSSRKYSKG